MNAHDLSILSMISDASLLAQAVMALLLVISLVSWTIIFRKLFAIKAAQRATNRFEEKFWQGAELNALYQEVSHASKDPGPMARIFEAGMKEFRRARQNGITGNGGPESSNIVLAPASRAMRAAFQREMDALESSLAFLASAGSVSPYIGLFGTVWGIMNAFRGLADVQQATLASVAPGIAEALVAPAIGLFAAIPAVVAYNRYAYDQQICEALVPMWARIGIRVKINSLPFASLVPKLETLDSSLWMLGWGSPDFDALQNLLSLAYTRSDKVDGTYNAARISDPKLDKLIDQARYENNPIKRTGLLQQALEIVKTQSYYLPLAHAMRAWVMQRSISLVVPPSERPEMRFVIVTGRRAGVSDTAPAAPDRAGRNQPAGARNK